MEPKVKEKTISADEQTKLPEPPANKEMVLADIMSPVVQNYLSRTAEEKRRFPAIPWPGMSGRKKVAICGLAHTTRHLAPFKDPAYDIWTMHEGITLLERVDLAFEPHDPLFAGIDTIHGFRETMWEPEYAKHLQETKIPVMMQDHYDQFPTSIKYPFKEIVDQFGRFFTTSVGWMMAMAIRNGYEQMDLYGVEMEHDTEYVHQSKCVVYFIGIAEGRGITVGTPRACQLMKNRYLYGLETRQQDEVIQRIDRHQGELNAQRQQLESQLASVQQEHQRVLGSVNACENIRRRILLAD